MILVHITDSRQVMGPGQQQFKPIGIAGKINAGHGPQHMQQIFVRFQIISFGCFDQAVNDRASPSAFGRVCEQAVLPADCEGSNATLRSKSSCEDLLRYPHLQEILIIPRTCAAVKTALVKDEDFLITLPHPAHFCHGILVSIPYGLFFWHESVG